MKKRIIPFLLLSVFLLTANAQNPSFSFKSSSDKFTLDSGNTEEQSGTIKIFPGVKTAQGDEKTTISKGVSYTISPDTEYKVEGNFTKLKISSNELTVLDVSGLTNLKELYCQINNLVSLDVSKLTKLEKLWCNRNKLTSLDISALSKLKELHCASNELSVCALDKIFLDLPKRLKEDDVKVFIQSRKFDENPAIRKCRSYIAKDKNWKVLAYKNTNENSHTLINNLAGPFECAETAPEVSFTFETSADATEFTLGKHTSSEATIEISPTVIDKKTNKQTSTLKPDASYTVSPNTVYTVAGDFSKLQVKENKLKALDVSGLTNLTELYCQINNLVSLDVSKLTKLEKLWCNRNQLTSLDISALSKLKELHCASNELSACDLDKIFLGLPKRLKTDEAKVFIQSRKFDENPVIRKCRSYIAKNKNWTVLAHKKGEETSHTLIDNSAGLFECAETAPEVSFTFETSADATEFTLGKHTSSTAIIEISPAVIDKKTNKQISTLKPDASYTVSPNTVYAVAGDFSKLQVGGNKLKALDVSGLTNLTELYCQNNNLVSLDVSKLTKLEKLWCNQNQLTNLDISALSKLKELHCAANELSVCDLDKICLDLPITKDDAKLFILNKDLLGAETVNKSRIYIAKDKGWKVLTYKGNADDSHKPMNNSTGPFECAETAPKVFFTFETSADATEFTLGKHTSSEATIEISPAVIDKKTNKQTGILKPDASYTVSPNTVYTVAGDFSKLQVKESKLKALDVSGLTNLTELYCQGNNLVSLDVSKLTNLEKLWCNRNKLTSLDISALSNLKELHCATNELSVCDLDKIFLDLPKRATKDEAKVFIQSRKFDENPVIRKCRSYIAKDKNWKVLAYKKDNEDSHTPMDNSAGPFECAETDPKVFFTIETSADATEFRIGNHTSSEATIEISPAVIDKKTNKQASILKPDTRYTVSPNTVYKVAGDFSKLQVGGNKLKALDVSGLTNLTELYCQINNLVSLDVSKLTNLEKLWCNQNQLTSLDISALSNLKELHCAANELSVCDLDKICLDLPKRATKDDAKLFMLNKNLLGTETINKSRIHIAKEKGWKVLIYQGGEGNTHKPMDDSAGPFECAETAPKVFFTFETSADTTEFTLGKHTISKATVEISPAVIDKKTAKQIGILKPDASYIVNPNTVYTVAGDCSKLEVKENNLKALDVSGLPNLTELYCQINSLVSLDARNLEKLEKIWCGDNQLTSLDVSTLPALKELHIYRNKFSVCEIDSVFMSLPKRKNTGDGVVFIADGDEKDDIYDKCRTPIAKERTWQVRDYNGAHLDSKSIVNTEFGCVAEVVPDDVPEVVPDVITELSAMVNKAGELSCYPNPMRDKLYVEAAEKIIELSLYDINGKLLIRKEGSSTKLSLQTQQLNPGMYILKVKTVLGTKSLKITKK